MDQKKEVKSHRINGTMKPSVWAKLEDYAWRNKTSCNDVICRLVEGLVNQQPVLTDTTGDEAVQLELELIARGL